jgi:predicted dehydrogenase
MIDQILRSFPIPQQVYALNSSLASDKQQRLYLTEDTAVVSLKFTDALTGSLIATRDFAGTAAAERHRLSVYGKDSILTVTGNRIVLTDLRDGSEQAQQFEETERDIMVRLLEGFAQSLDAADEQRDVSSLAENLTNMAVLESAYLSARTGFPEEPSRVLQRAKNFSPSGVTKV